MTHYKKLTGSKCYLSPISLDDAVKMAEWENDLAVTLPLGDEAYNTTSLEKLTEDLRGALHAKMNLFGILDLATDQLIGRCVLFNFDPVNRSAMLGIFIGVKEYWGKGYGSEAVQLLVEFGFYLLNLNSIELGVYAFNERAIAAYRKVGFKEIGRRRQARIIGPKKYDVILMDLLADEYTPRYIQAYLP